MYFVEVFLLAFLFLFIFCLAVLLSFLPLIFLKQNYTSTKISSYECGFVPFSDVRLQFEIKFYFIGVTFVLFDIEFSYLFPWIINFTDISLESFFFLHLFIIILTLGYIRERMLGIFDW